MKPAILLGLLCFALQAETVAYQGFTLLDGAGGAPLSGAAMIVENGRITWVGSTAQLKVPQGAAVNDLAGKFVMPGIINLHGHVSVTEGLVQDTKRFYTRENVEKNLALYASYGVTSVVSMGADQPLGYTIRAGATERAANGSPPFHRRARIYGQGRISGGGSWNGRSPV